MARLPNFVRWHLIFVRSQYGNLFMSAWCLELWGGSQICGKICACLSFMTREEWLWNGLNVKLTSYACSQETRSTACNEGSESHLSYHAPVFRSHCNKCSNQNANWSWVWEPTQCIGCYQFWSGLLGQSILVILLWYIHTYI